MRSFFLAAMCTILAAPGAVAEVCSDVQMDVAPVGPADNLDKWSFRVITNAQPGEGAYDDRVWVIGDGMMRIRNRDGEIETRRFSPEIEVDFGRYSAYCDWSVPEVFAPAFRNYEVEGEVLGVTVHKVECRMQPRGVWCQTGW